MTYEQALDIASIMENTYDAWVHVGATSPTTFNVMYQLMDDVGVYSFDTIEDWEESLYHQWLEEDDSI